MHLLLRTVSLMTWVGCLVLRGSDVAAQPFTEISQQAGFQEEAYSFSATFGDLDGDGWLDLFVANGTGGAPDYVYHNGRGGDFLLTQDSALVLLQGNSSSGRWVDYDGDGDLDLMVANLSGSIQLLRNLGTAGFENVDLPPLTDGGRASRRIAPADVDGDGDIDLFVTQRQDKDNLLFLNDGDGTYRQVSEKLIAQGGGDSTCAEWADVDNDGDLDLFVGNTNNQPDLLYENLGGGDFRMVDVPAISARRFRTTSASWGDYDLDGDLDLYVANIGEFNGYFENLGNWVFQEVVDGDHVQFAAESNGTNAVDVDNDGDLDLFVANRTGVNPLFLNDGHGRFSRAEGFLSFSDTSPSAGSAWGDFDRDGDVDLFVTNLGSGAGSLNQLFRNDLDLEQGGWLHLALKGQPPNTAAIGARVSAKVRRGNESIWMIREVTGGLGSGVSGDELAFGLGGAPGVDSLVIRWPNGIVEAVGKVDGNRRLVIPQAQVLQATQVRFEPGNRALARPLAYPNPTSADARVHVTLQEAGPLQLQVYDLLGRRIWEESIQANRGEQSIPVSLHGRPAGVYYIVLRRRGIQLATARLVKSL